MSVHPLSSSRAIDPVALSNNFVQGKTWLGSVMDGSAPDADPASNSVAFDIGNLPLAGVTTVAALVTYSRDNGLTTQAGRAVTALFSNPVTVKQVASPLRIGSISYANGNVTFNVSGGAPPFQLQVRTNLTAATWADFGAAFTSSPITFPTGGADQGFYRVTSQ